MNELPDLDEVEQRDWAIPVSSFSEPPSSASHWLKRGLCFIGLLIVAGCFVVLSALAYAPDDPEGMRPAAQSVRDLGREAYQENCQPLPNNTELCR